MRVLAIIALALLLVAWCVYAATLAFLGLWFSLVCRTSARAILATLGTTLALTFAHWLPWMCCAIGGMGCGGSGLLDVLLVQVGATPPSGRKAMAVGWSARPGRVASNDRSSDRPAYTPASSGSTSRSTTSRPNLAPT